MLLCDSFFAPLKHKYLESSIKKTLKTAEPFFRNLISLKNKIPATGLFLSAYVQQLLQGHVTYMSRTMISACRHSIEINSQNIVISRLELDNCLQFLLGRKFISLC